MRVIDGSLGSFAAAVVSATDGVDPSALSSAHVSSLAQARVGSRRDR
ncbi:hypothetical protein [Cellulomonas triticagri]|nr:hypothetical protein [Cellulomonas triticagri]